MHAKHNFEVTNVLFSGPNASNIFKFIISSPVSVEPYNLLALLYRTYLYLRIE